MSTDARRSAAIVSGKIRVGRRVERKRLDKSDLLNELHHSHCGCRQWFVGQILADQAVVMVRRDVGMVVFRLMIMRISRVVMTMPRNGAVFAGRASDG